MWIWERLKTKWRGRRYDQIVMLGCNCEIAFRFYKHYRFLDSGLLGWSAVPSLAVLKDVLNHPEYLLSRGIADPEPLYRCVATGIDFHGRHNWKKGEVPDPAAVAEDKVELVGRVEYLKQKLERYRQSGKKTLYIVKISPAEAKSSSLNTELAELYALLREQTKGPSDLLCICENAVRDAISFQAEHFYVRGVAAYNPADSVTDLQFGDRRGWTLIFDEFRPKYRLKRKNPFKFEKD